MKSAVRVRGVREIRKIVYSQDFSRDRFAGLVPLVVEVAQTGDQVARGLLAYAGRALARAAFAVLTRLYELHDPVRVHLTVGVFHAGELITAPFREALRVEWPKARASPGKGPPVIGALMLACRFCSVPGDERWLVGLKTQIPD